MIPNLICVICAEVWPPDRFFGHYCKEKIKANVEGRPIIMSNFMGLPPDTVPGYDKTTTEHGPWKYVKGKNY